MSLILHFENASSDNTVPGESDVHRWSLLALQNSAAPSEICIRLVDEQESELLNSTYRGKDKPTNVLSFPAELPDDVDSPLLGDLAICTQVVNREAQQQGKTTEVHWAHMVIHGCLHLQGYDHIDPQDAADMEQLETRLLATMGFPDPYIETDANLASHLHGPDLEPISTNNNTEQNND